jgi:hypothetical protein
MLFDKKNHIEVNNLIIESENDNLFEKSYDKIIKLQNNWRAYKARLNFSKVKSEKKFNYENIPGLELSQNQIINRSTVLMEETEKKLGQFDPQKKLSLYTNNLILSSNLNNNSNNNLNLNSYRGNYNSNGNNNYYNIINNQLNNNSINISKNNSFKENSSACDNNDKNNISSEKEIYIPLRITSILYPDNTIYSGSFNLKWEKHGFGTLYTKYNEKISGFFKEDKLNGRGRIIYPEGDYFEGEFVDDKLCGYGEYSNIEGIKYIGEWKDDMKNGFGEEIHYDGTVYVGEFKNDLKHGKGRFKWQNGNIFEGNLIKNQIEGIGKMVFYDNQFYKGEWKTNKIDGRGIFIWPDKKVYIGNYKNEKKWGYGIFVWPNGRRYEGQWLNGKQHGFGICYWNQKKQLSEWRLGKKQKMENDSIEEMKNKIINIIFNTTEILEFLKSIGLEIDANFGYIKIESIKILNELSAPPINNENFLKKM